MRTARDSGMGATMAILSLALLAAVVACTVQILPFYLGNYELQSYLNNVAVQAAVHPSPPTVKTVQDEILIKAESLGLPVERKDIKVSISRTVRIQVDYMVYVDLKLHTVTLHFTPSAESSNIT